MSKNVYDTHPYSKNNKGVAVIIETRDIPHLSWVIDNIIHHTGWEVILFHGENRVSSNCTKVKLPYDMNVNRYNDLLKSVGFWESFEHENILIFQHDSFMLRSGIDEYLDFDYVGAPWYWANDPSFKDPRYKDLSIFRNGGNGGFSIRKKSVMLDIINKYYDDPNEEDKYLNEDMFFSKYIHNYKYSNLQKSKEFCVETMFHENPIAIHAIDRYLTDNEIKKILNI